VKGHVGVDFVTSRLSPRLRVACEIITTLLSLFIIAIVVWQGWVEGTTEKGVSDQLRIPQYPFRVLVAVGGFLLWLELLIDLFGAFGKLRRNEL
jgi:TRAP-type C4-dicarboxylate transport system permease small subunit